MVVKKKIMKSDLFFNAVMSDSEFLFGTNHHLAKNSIFGQERFFFPGSNVIGYFLTGNTHPFCQSTGTMRQVNNNASHSSQCFGHLFDVQEVKYMFSSIKRS